MFRSLSKPLVAGVLILTVSLSACDSQKTRVQALRDSAKGKNVVMVLLDAAAFGHFGLAGYDRNTTPVIDALAREGITFDNAYSPSASTGHAVYAMLTSTYPFLAEKQGLKGILDDAFRVTETTSLMAEKLAPRFPHRSGISANEWFGAEFGFDRGFTHFYETHTLPDSTSHRAQLVVQLFRQDLAEWGDGPAFSYVHFLEPHTPYTPPDEFARMFHPTAADSVDARSRALIPYKRNAPAPPLQRKIRALYDGNLAYVDAMVGEIVESLKQAGKWDDTIFVVLADHGEAFWQHGAFGHGRHIYEEFMRIPLVVRVPGAEQLAGTRVSPPVSLIDLMPTYLDWLDLDPSPGQRGDSLLPLMAGFAKEYDERPVYLRNTHSDAPEFGLRWTRYKWIYKVYEGRYELYDLLEDPGELHDLVAANAIPPAAAPWREKVALWLAVGTERVAPVDEIDPATMERLRAIGYF